MGANLQSTLSQMNTLYTCRDLQLFEHTSGSCRATAHQAVPNTANSHICLGSRAEAGAEALDPK